MEFEVRVDYKLCTGCGKCMGVCPKGPRIWRTVVKEGREVYEAGDLEMCLNCTSCVGSCPVKAIRIEW